MKATTLFNRFLSENADIKGLAKAVINQMGGTDGDTLAELNQVRNASDGYSGFIYYSDTIAFWKRVRKIAIPFMEDEANSLGERSALDMVKSFNYCKQHDVEDRDIALALYGRMADADDFILNLLAWYVLETVAFRFSDWCYENNYDYDYDYLSELK